MLAKATIRTIKFNISLSMTINAVAILLSSLGLLTPITGAIVHNVGSVLVVLNAALLYDRKFVEKAEKYSGVAAAFGENAFGLATAFCRLRKIRPGKQKIFVRCLLLRWGAKKFLFVVRF